MAFHAQTLSISSIVVKVTTELHTPLRAFLGKDVTAHSKGKPYHWFEAATWLENL